MRYLFIVLFIFLGGASIYDAVVTQQNDMLNMLGVKNFIVAGEILMAIIWFTLAYTVYAIGVLKKKIKEDQKRLDNLSLAVKHLTPWK